MNYTYETDIQIIRQLFSHITDLKLLCSGYGTKSYEEIDDEIKETEKLCTVIYA